MAQELFGKHRNGLIPKFLASYSSYVLAVEPEAFDVCPILLTQPAQDRWTPLHLSELFLRRIGKVPVKTVMLENAGHYPIEQPGLQQMHEAIVEFIDTVCFSMSGRGF